MGPEFSAPVSGYRPDRARFHPYGSAGPEGPARGPARPAILLNFIYTNYTDVRPITTAMLTRVQRGLISRGWWARDVVFLTVTTDPARDTVAVLATYARRYMADFHELPVQMGRRGRRARMCCVIPSTCGERERYRCAG